MLKKYVALFLALAILIGSVSALAESASVGVSAAQTGTTIKQGDVTFTAEGKLADCGAEAYAHLGGYTAKDRNGNTTTGTGLSIGATAENAGASTSANIQYGSKDNNVKASVEAIACGERVEIGLDAGVQNGKLNVQAGAAAELIGAQATATAAGTVSGIETKVSGSVNVGIGASAAAGIKEGKLTVDVGVTLGIGAKVKVEVDVGTAAKKVAKTASSAWKKLKRLF